MAELFATTDYQSILFVVSQYWNDNADDELHGKLVASKRHTMPLWPHVCAYNHDPIYDDEGNEQPNPVVDHGEGCNWCSPAIGYLDIYTTADTRAFETFCREDATQGMDIGEAYLPYAIGRRGADGGVEIEILGVPQRPALEIAAHAPPPTTSSWIDDPRARALYELVCANPRDDGARLVLGDYLLEREHPHGELIALSLAGALDSDGRIRLAQLLADQAQRWLGPLADLIPHDSARFERGFLAHAYVAATPEAERRARGHPAWGTVERIDMSWESAAVLDASMVSLREIGMLDSDEDHERLFGVKRPWAIEKLRIAVEDASTVDALASTTLLPKLEEIVVAGSRRFDAIARLARGDTRRPKKIVVVDPGTWPPSRELLELGHTIGVVDAWNGDRAGWELAFGPGADDKIVVTMVGWHPERGTLAALHAKIANVPAGYVIELAPSPYFTPVARDVEALIAATDRRHHIVLQTSVAQ